MGVDEVVGLVRSVASVDGSSDRGEVIQAVADLAAIRRWCDGREVALAGFMHQHSPIPEKPMAKAARSSQRQAKKVLQRGETAGETPALGKALEKGEVSGEHVDAAGSALRSADQAKRGELAKRIDALTGKAATMSAEEFGRLVRAEAERLAGDGGEERLARQQRAIRFHHRVEPASGMIEFWGKLDPLRGMTFVNRLRARVNELFADKTPDGAPPDSLEKHAYLQALALLDLCERGGGRAGRPEVVVVVDTRASGGDGPTVDWGLPVELPVKVLTDLVARADVHTVVVRDGAIVHAPGRLDLGAPRGSRTPHNEELCARSTRGARSPIARRGSTTARSTTSRWWRHGGRTDLHNLLPVCVRHHTADPRPGLGDRARAKPDARGDAAERRGDDDRPAEPPGRRVTSRGRSSPSHRRSDSSSAFTAFVMAGVNATSSWTALTRSVDVLRSAIASTLPTTASPWSTGSA